MCCAVKGTIYGLIYLVLQVVVLVLYIVISPYDTLRMRRDSADSGFGGAKPPYGNDATHRDLPCFTVWNYRTVCNQKSTGQSFINFVLSESTVPISCTKQRDYFIATAAMVAITLLFAVLAIINGICALLSCFQYKCCALIFALITAASSIASWALLVTLYNRRLCGNSADVERYKEDFTYGTSFVLMCVGSGIQVISILVVIMA